jgi:putative resolvase
MKVNIGTAAKHFGVSQETLRRWEKSGKIHVDRTPKGHRRFDLSQFSHRSLRDC